MRGKIIGKEKDMGNKIRRNKRFFMLLIFGILFCGAALGKAGMAVRAEERTDVREDVEVFLIDAQMLPSDRSAYEIQVKVENLGLDFQGTVRLKLVEDYYGGANDCAYDTELSLPQGSTKQFVVRIPKDSIDRTDGVVQLTLLDKNAFIVAQKELGRLLQAEADALTMGILSDEYQSLTYLDIGGNEFYYRNKSYPIRLEELDQDNLEDSLEVLDFLLIDNYNTGVLSDQAVESVMQWIGNGGMLIIGTGSRAGEVLDGLEDLEIECVKVSEPGSDEYVPSDYVDTSLLSMAELADVSGSYEEGYGVFVLEDSIGNGAVGVLPYSLSEVARTDAAGDYEQQRILVENMLRQVSDCTNYYYGSGQNNFNSPYLSEGVCSFLGKGSLKFGMLKVMVILYVIFAGPVLYLILRFVKKRELYWIAVPVTVLVGIFLVYWAGRGFQVVSTNVYSVTIENLSDGGDARTYLRCYDAGHGEWELRLAEGYKYVGPVEDSYYKSSEDGYYYHIRKEGERLFFGLNPSVGFEDGYFQAGIAGKPKEGSISGSISGDLQNGQWSLNGTVVNETKWDFVYFAVHMGSDLFIYKNLPAGSTVKLEEVEMLYGDDVQSYGYSIFGQGQGEDWEKDLDILAALSMGLTFASEYPDSIVIMGVTEDWDKVVDDNCSEVSYGCLYAVQ